MEKKITMGWAVLAIALLFLTKTADSANAITCPEAISTLSPCKPFLVGSDVKPSAPCCIGVQIVYKKVPTKADRQALCECFKKSGPGLGVKPDKAKQLPGLCGVPIKVPIGPDVDCRRVGFP